MNVECDMVQAAIPLFVDGQMDESKRAAVLDHASGCDACGAALEFQIRLRGAIESGPLSPPSEGFFDSVLDRVHARMDAAEASQAGWARLRERIRGYWESAQWGFSLAGAGVMALAAVLAFRAMLEGPEPAPRGPAGSVVSTPAEASLVAELAPTALPTPAALARKIAAPVRRADRAAERDAGEAQARIARAQLRLAAPRR